MSPEIRLTIYTFRSRAPRVGAHPRWQEKPHRYPLLTLALDHSRPRVRIIPEQDPIQTHRIIFSHFDGGSEEALFVQGICSCFPVSNEPHSPIFDGTMEAFVQVIIHPCSYPALL